MNTKEASAERETIPVDALRIGFASAGMLKKPVEDGQIVTIDDVSLANAGALDVWNCILGRATQYRQRAAYQ
jgi:predicted homoserine dehydrogenase-like protein